MSNSQQDLIQKALSCLAEIPVEKRNVRTLSAAMRIFYLNDFYADGIRKNYVRVGYNESYACVVPPSEWWPKLSFVLVTTVLPNYSAPIHDHGEKAANLLALIGDYYNVNYRFVKQGGGMVLHHQNVDYVAQGNTIGVGKGRSGIHRAVNFGKDISVSLNFLYSKQEIEGEGAPFVYDFGGKTDYRITLQGDLVYFAKGEDKVDGILSTDLIKFEDCVLKLFQLTDMLNNCALSEERMMKLWHYGSIFRSVEFANLRHNALVQADQFVSKQLAKTRPAARAYFDALFALADSLTK